MNLIEKLYLMERLDALIRRRATGTPQELASRLNISERSVYNLIEQMKRLDAPIIYCKDSCSYRYEWQVGFRFGFTKLSENGNMIVGGRNKSYLEIEHFCINMDDEHNIEM